MSDKKHIPAGVWLKCDKGSKTEQLIVLPRSIKLYEENWAVETDAVPLVNIPSFTNCAINGTCVPATEKWLEPVDGEMTVVGVKPIKNDSFCLCPIGGKINIYFDRQAAANSISADEAQRKAAEAKEDSEEDFWWGVGAAVLVGAVCVVAVVATGGAAAPLLIAAATTALEGAAVGAVVGGTVGAVAGGVEGYAHTGTLEGTLSGAGSGAWSGIKMGAAGGAVTALGGGAFLVPSMADFISGVAYDVEAMYYEPTVERGLVLLADAIVLFGSKKAEEVISEKIGVKFSERWCKDPVDPITGNVFYPYIDFELPGPIPLKWEREYNSASKYKGILGRGVSSGYDLFLYEDFERNVVEILQKNGTALAVNMPTVEEPSYHSVAQIEVFSHENSYKVFDYKNRIYYTYQKIETGVHKPILIEDERGFSIQLFFSGKKLEKIIDSTGRTLNITSNDQGFITRIELPTVTETRILVEYEYDSAGNMIAIYDALKQKTAIRYDAKHRMVEKTDRNGQTFYWKYNEQGKCIHTWGEGDLLEGFFEYGHEKVTLTDPTGLRETYYYNKNFKPVKITDAFNNSEKFKYDEKDRLIEYTNQEELITQYKYDENGNLTKKILPDESSYSYLYDKENNLLLVIDPNGGTRQWVYDEKSRLISIRDSFNNKQDLVYNEKGLITKIINASGDDTLFEYDDRYNLVKMILPHGNVTEWQYNTFGECTEIINPLGKKQQFEYDRLGRLKNVKLPTSEIIDLKYDAYDNVLKINSLRNKIDFTYTPLGSIKSREENGVKVNFDYDLQERLKTLSNEQGDQYKFFRNERGDIVKEVSFDGVTKYYNRDRAGKVVKIKREGNRYTEYEYNKRGQIVRADYHDGYWETFDYDKSGYIIEARNPDNNVRFTRDKNGLVLQEIQGIHIIDYLYDEKGSLISLKSSLGADVSYERDKYGRVSTINSGAGEDQWVANIKRNMLGLEIERTLPGGVISSWSYNAENNPIKHTVVRGQEKKLNRTYSWNANQQLHQITNGISGGVTEFGYDIFTSLAWAEYEDGSKDYKMPDEVGSLFRTKGQKDRIYGKGGKLLKDENWYYKYDAEGNLKLKSKRNIAQAQLQNRQLQLEIDKPKKHSFFVEEITTETPKQKTLDYYLRTDIKYTREEKEEYKRLKEQTQVQTEEWQHGDWHYTWQANGMLKSVKKPDGSLVDFEYDALGRRTAKIHQEKVTRFVWDGNALLHEWNYEQKKRPRLSLDNEGEFSYTSTENSENLVTWVYEDGSLVPSAKIQGEKKYSIISDYVGRPIEAYDWEGSKVWETDYDIYGKLRHLKGNKNFVPFRQLGQYEDEELEGLYYNRFRYYDCNIGGYISQDPIGLEGNNPNFYAYVWDSNLQFDPFGLECPKAVKIANKIIEQAKAGKFRKIPPGKISPDGYHGRLTDARVTEILSNPDAVYKSTGNSENLIFRQGEDIAVVSGNPAGSQKGQVITSYGPSGPRGESGASIYGGSSTDPGLPITDGMITNGTIPKPNGGFVPKATNLGL